MPVYTVTFCAMDTDIANTPYFGHACLLLSSYDPEKKKLEVVDNWGFYGVPTTAPDSFVRDAKIKLGLDVDMTGNHGMLRREATRDLDRGCGLNGVTFELTPEKFQALQEKCKKMAREQNEAIDEVIKPLNLIAAEKAKPRIYPYEHLSQSIFSVEKQRAKLEHREPRLKDFQLVSCNGIRNCKVQIVDLLKGILTPEQIARVEGYSAAIPRLSGTMEKMFLHSIGPNIPFTKSSGEIVPYRNQKIHSSVKLYWTLPPQETELISDEARQLFAIKHPNIDALKKVISQLQKLEWFFMSAKLDSKHEKYRNELLELIHDAYEVFSIIEPKQGSRADNSWSANLAVLFSHPADAEAQTLLNNFENAIFLLNSLYMAVVDSWELDEEGDDPDIEAIAAYLPDEEKQKLCSILGRSYVQREQELKMT